MRRKWEIGRGQPERGGMQGLLDRVGGSGGYGGSRRKPEGLLSTSKRKKEQEIDDSPRDPRITERILRDNGYQEATTLHGRKQQTFVPLNDKGKYRIYTGWTSGKGAKQGVSQTTLNNPSVKELLRFLGY